jgi:putative long chain acyl-CoA synthase
MERIDPDAVPLPAWYQPNPGRSRDLAFILFTGRNEKTRMNRITNRRWAVSAFGTASAAALDSSDTVYCLTPVHHPSGLLTAIGGAVAGGTRLAMATQFDPSTFWDEVRRYGVTVVSYTWTLTRELVEAPRNPAERHHPVRLFVGSGMPSGLWRRTVERFGAAVLEFYASTEGEAVLVNLSGQKIGAKGRRLPGSARVRLAAVDMDHGLLRVGEDGLAIRPQTGEVGMLLAEADTEQGGLLGAPLRGMFEKGDAWHSTGDLFRQDEDGDYWLVDHVDGLVRTAQGVIPTLPIEDALFKVPSVDLVSAYGLPAKDGTEVPAAAITVRRGTELDARAITHALLPLEEAWRPLVVRVVDRVPVSTWFRPLKRQLRDEGVPEGSEAFVWQAKSETYKPMTEAARKRLKLAAG